MREYFQHLAEQIFTKKKRTGISIDISVLHRLNENDVEIAAHENI